MNSLHPTCAGPVWNTVGGWGPNRDTRTLDVSVYAAEQGGQGDL